MSSGIRFFHWRQIAVCFRGGEIYNSEAIGKKTIPDITRNIDGFMRFETDDKDKLLLLLKKHPVIIEGGTLEICEMPKR